MFKALVPRVARISVGVSTVLAATVSVLAFVQYAHAIQNPAACTDPSVALRIREFFDQNDDGTPDSPIPISPQTQKQPGDIILYQAALSHSAQDRCGYQGGILCIDLPRIGCPAANPAV